MTSQLILRDTHSILFINKPPNVPFHNSDTTPGVVTLLRQHLGPNYPHRIYPVHRLDAMTSGAMMFAKSPEAAREIIQKFRERKVSKYYIAISDRKPAKKMGSVIGDMTRGRRGSWMMQRTTENPAITRFIATAVPDRPGKIAFLLKPETGRTHQLRVAMKAIGSAVLGDVRYANTVEAGKEARGYLHCAALRLVIGGSIHQVVCPPFPLPPYDVAEGTAAESEFSTSGFQELFKIRWFHPELENDTGVWFPEKKLLRSTPEALF